MQASSKHFEPLEANGITEYLNCVQAIRTRPGWFPKDDQWGPWFRGHQNAGWLLKPKLYRDRDYAEVRADEVEDEIREEFIKRAPILCETLPSGGEDRAEWEWYFMMQHFGVQTRLLDWTGGALIALYFAVRNNFGPDDAAVWVLDPYQLNKTVIGQAWVIPPSATGLTIRERKLVKPWLPVRFTHMRGMRKEAVAVEPSHVARRISSQHSCFTIHGKNEDWLDKLHDGGSGFLDKIVIPRSKTQEIKKELRGCGIDEMTIFPDLEGLSRAINARWERFECRIKQETPHSGVYARIRPSKIHGIGVFAIRNIPKGTKIFPADEGELVWRKKSDLKLDQLPQEIRRFYDQFCLIKDKGETYGCPKNFNLMTVAWYLNHSKTPNVGCDQDYTFFALRNIRDGEELTADYHTYNEFLNADWV